MASNYIDDLKSLYSNKIFLKENVGLGPEAEDYEAPERKCLCSDEDDECSCHKDEEVYDQDDMIISDRGHRVEHETNAYMAKQQLYRTVKMASMLHDIINDDEELEPWMASKITQAFDDLNAIFGYKDYQHFRDKINQDIEIEEKTEQDLYKSIDIGGESIINKIKELMHNQPREKVEDAVYGMIKMLEA